MFKKIMSLILVSLIISGCAATVSNTKKETLVNINKLPETTLNYTELPGKADMSGYSLLKDDNPAYSQLDLNEFADKYDNKVLNDGVYYFGFESCPYCQQAVPVLNYALKEKNTYAYYVNIYTSRFDENGNKTEHGDEYYARAQEFLDKYLDDDKVVYAPAVVFVKNGKIKQYTLGLETKNGKIKLAKKNQNHLLDVYRKGLNKIK